jgi:Beta-propeller repeat
MRRSFQSLVILSLFAALVTVPSPFSGTGHAAGGHLNHAQAEGTIAKAYSRLPLSFEANRGQTNKSVDFVARGSGTTLFLTKSGAALTLRKSLTRTVTAQLRLVGANLRSPVLGINRLPGTVNYFVGENARSWHVNIPTFARVMYRSIYPGIDMVFYGRQGHLEYDFVLSPGADPRAIDLRFPGAQPLRLDRTGNLIEKIDGLELRQVKPTIYQMYGARKSFVGGHFVLASHNNVRFALGRYDSNRTLVIDPTISYATYLGGSASDGANAIAVDSAGNAYVTGQTFSTNFPVAGTLFTSCHLNTSNKCSGDAFVTKLNAAGTSVVYSTYLGGLAADQGNGIATDSAGDAYVVGATQSKGFPVYHALQGKCKLTSTSQCSGDAFAAELTSSGNGLLYSTYIGGTGSDSAQAVAVDNSGAAYVAGHSASSDFPVCPGSVPPCASSGTPLQAVNHGLQDGFVAKLTYNSVTATTSLTYSTYLGGSSYDQASAIKVDSSGAAYVTGFTDSTNFPLKHPVQAKNASQSGYADAFVAKLGAAGVTLVYSTFLGGGLDDYGYGLALDSANNVYVVGQTGSSNFPVKSALQATRPGLDDAFVTKLTFSSTTGVLALAYSTYLGGSSYDYGFAIAVDGASDAYVTGITDSTNLPTTVNAWQAAPQGGDEAFVIELSPTDTLLYGTYYGGSLDDRGTGIAVDSSNNFYVVGTTTSTNFPTVTPFQSANAGGQDAFVLQGHS